MSFVLSFIRQSLSAKSSADTFTTQELTELFAVFTVSFIFFWICYAISHVVYENACRKNVAYHELKSDKKADYLSRVVANIHAVFSCIAAYLSFYYTW